MKNIVDIYDPVQVQYLANVLSLASLNEQKVSVYIHPGVYGGLVIKRGESCWTAPLGDVRLD